MRWLKTVYQPQIAAEGKAFRRWTAWKDKEKPMAL
jgi:hypothetical protein